MDLHVWLHNNNIRQVPLAADMVDVYSLPRRNMHQIAQPSKRGPVHSDDTALVKPVASWLGSQGSV